MNYKTAPLTVRERLAITPSEFEAFYATLREGTAEGFLLSTCNRTEIYALSGHAGSGSAALMSILAEFRGMAPRELEQYAYRLGFEDAVRHLFAVASGVDSMVPGEEQIMAQLRIALRHARAHGALGPVLHRLGAAALAAGKRVRSETMISRRSLSVVSVALRAASSELGTLTDRRVLIVGAGQTAQLALKHLQRPPAKVTICNRTEDTAHDVARPFGAAVVPWDALPSAISDADLVVSCTNAPDIVVDADCIEQAMNSRPDRPLLLVDLALPRDIDPRAGTLDGVRLMDLDHLEALSADNRRSRTAEVARAQEIINSSAENFMTWWNARQVAPTITALLASATQTRDREVERALARMPHLSERDRDALRTLGARIVAQLFHHPMRTMKTSAEGANLARAVQELFGLPDNAALAAPPADAVARAHEAPERSTLAPECPADPRQRERAPSPHRREHAND